MRKKPFLNLFLFFCSFLWLHYFSRSVLPVHFLSQGIKFYEMILGVLLTFFGQAVVVIMLKNFSAKTMWYVSLPLYYFSLLSVFTIGTIYQFYLAAFIFGLALSLFFIPYNIAHFENTHQTRIGTSSALMFSMPLFINFFAPPLAGFLIEINKPLLWVLAFVFLLPPLLLIKRQKDFSVNFSFSIAIKEIAATRLFIFLEGIWEALVFGLIPVYTLYFIKTPLFYGTYLAYLALMAIFANLFLGRLTDRWQKRTLFLVPVTILIGIATMVFSLSKNNLFGWIITTSAIQFLGPLFWNLSTAMVVDSSQNIKLAMVGRELILNIGRVLGLLLVFLSFYKEETPHLIFYVLGPTMIFYSLILWWRKKVKKLRYL